MGHVVAQEFVDAFGARDHDRMVATMAEGVVLDGPFPIGNKSGPKKAAKALLGVAKLGVKLSEPVSGDAGTESAVQSPAGAMVLRFTVEDERITRLDVSKP